jgi:hypothetical protein
MSRKQKPAETDKPAESGTEAPSNETFAEAEEKKYPPIADPFQIRSDRLAGIRLFESRRHNDFRGMVIQFGEGKPEDKPSQEVIDKVKQAGFRWNSQEKVWQRPMQFGNAPIVRLDADRLFNELSKAIRQERGVEPATEVAM